MCLRTKITYFWKCLVKLGFRLYIKHWVNILCVCPCIRSWSLPPFYNLPVIQCVLLHLLFKMSQTDVDSFTKQVHFIRMRLSLPPRDHYHGPDSKGLQPNVNFLWAYPVTLWHLINVFQSHGAQSLAAMKTTSHTENSFEHLKMTFFFHAKSLTKFITLAFRIYNSWIWKFDTWMWNSDRTLSLLTGVPLQLELTCGINFETEKYFNTKLNGLLE